MISDLRTWVLLVLLAFLLIGLIGYARGDEHHRGDDIGSWGHLGVTARP